MLDSFAFSLLTPYVIYLYIAGNILANNIFV